MSNLILRKNVSPPGLPLNLVLSAKPDPVVIESFVGDVYWRFEDEPDAEPKYLGSARAGGELRSSAIDLKAGRAVRLYLVSRSADGAFSVDLLANAVQTVVELNTETATPDIGQLTAATNTQVTIGIYGWTTAARFRKVQVANNNTFSSGLVETIIESSEYAGNVFPADLSVTKPASSGTETKYIRVAHSSNGVTYSSWSNTLTVVFADSGGSGGSGGGWEGTCFAGDTLITLDESGDCEEIQNLRVGTTVMAYDAVGNSYPAKVTAIRSHEADEILRLQGAGFDLWVTGEHLLLAEDRRFRRARDFAPGDTLWLCPDGRWLPATIVAVGLIRTPVTVYSIEVEPPHTHFANGIAVHNSKQIEL